MSTVEMSDFFSVDADTPDSSEQDIEQQRQEPPQTQPDEKSSLGVAPDEKSQVSTGRIIRRRARKACVECHKRKVRCDVLTRGQVCTNCRLDGQPCTIRSNDGRRKSHATQAQHARVPEPEAVSEPPVQDTDGFPAIPGGVISFAGYGNNDTKPSRASQSGHAIKSQYQAPPVSFSYHDMIFSYFDFIEGEQLSHIPPEDFKFLEHKGCFHIPSKPILDEFVREYFLHVHPALPMLDEKEFWELYLGDPQGGRPSKKLSLFLFRAMLFVSCSFVNLETIKLMGFQDAMEARALFYRRAKLLYDFDATSDSISIAQGALLLTYYSSDREPLANTTWLRTAIQFATVERAHLYYQHSNITPEERIVKKRLWWCCILRDRILPLGVRRSIQITRDNFNFSQEPLTEEDLSSEIGHSPIYDPEMKQALALTLKRLINLAIILTDVLTIIYPIKQLDHNNMMEMPKLIQNCKQDLNSWFESQGDRSFSGFFSTHSDSLTLFHGLNQIYYHSARAALCQYEALAMQASRQTTNILRNKELGSELHSSIAKISKIVGELVEIDAAKYLPVSMVAYLALPMILNSIDLQTASQPTNSKTSSTGIAHRPTFKNESKRRQLRLYNEAMEVFQARYTGARACAIVMNKTIASARQEIIYPNTAIQRLQDSSSTALLRTGMGRNQRVEDWLEVFVSQPRQYLRIALTVDISLCRGRYAETGDLPGLLMLEDSVFPEMIGMGSLSGGLSRGLTPPEGEKPGLFELEMGFPILNEGEEERGRDARKDLDYLDFGVDVGVRDGEGSDIGSGRGSGVHVNGIWSGTNVESILEETLRGSYENL